MDKDELHFFTEYDEHGTRVGIRIVDSEEGVDHLIAENKKFLTAQGHVFKKWHAVEVVKSNVH